MSRGCRCGATADAPRDDCPVHGIPDPRFCPDCGQLVAWTAGAVCKRCGWIRPPLGEEQEAMALIHDYIESVIADVPDVTVIARMYESPAVTASVDTGAACGVHWLKYELATGRVYAATHHGALLIGCAFADGDYTRLDAPIRAAVVAALRALTGSGGLAAARLLVAWTAPAGRAVRTQGSGT